MLSAWSLRSSMLWFIKKPPTARPMPPVALPIRNEPMAPAAVMPWLLSSELFLTSWAAWMIFPMLAASSDRAPHDSSRSPGVLICKVCRCSKLLPMMSASLARAVVVSDVVTSVPRMSVLRNLILRRLSEFGCVYKKTDELCMFSTCYP